MCWSETASIAMVAIGSAATAISAWRGAPKAIWITLGYFTIMEALQAAGYTVVDQCDTVENRSITLLSYLHIVFQPIFINAFAMELVPETVKAKIRNWVFLACGASCAIMLAQILPPSFIGSWAGQCLPGSPLCGASLCLVSGEWHIAWNIPYNGLLVPFENAIGLHAGFPTYMVTVFALPLIYGAWRFVGMHVITGPVAAHYLTGSPNEIPAVWCLFSIAILTLAISPPIRQRFQAHEWFGWPKAWQT